LQGAVDNNKFGSEQRCGVEMLFIDIYIIIVSFLYSLKIQVFSSAAEKGCTIKPSSPKRLPAFSFQEQRQAQARLGN
jgi:hypothetical protein